MDVKELTALASEIADADNADILLYTGAIDRPFDDRLIEKCRKATRRKNVVFMLCTYGGDPNAGYRIARCLQQMYERFTVLIDGPCKSAGTLITVGAHQIVMSDHGEMGPLDVQIGKKDEIWETDSGLTVLSAIKALEEKSFDLFESCFLNLKSRSGGRITLKTATEIASKLAIGAISPIVAQIDPLHVGEVSRAMNIGLEYGRRLSKISKNADEKALQSITNSYPSHGFVIDREEAKTLFENVRSPTDKESELLNLVQFATRRPDSETFFEYLSEPPKGDQHESSDQGNDPEGGEGGSAPASGAEGGQAGASESPQAVELRQILGRRRAKS